MPLKVLSDKLTSDTPTNTTSEKLINTSASSSSSQKYVIPQKDPASKLFVSPSKVSTKEQSTVQLLQNYQ